MSESFLGGRVFLEAGDCRDVLAELPSNMFHACVTDPPYHLTSVVQRFGGANAAPVKTYKTGAYGGGFKEANGGTGAAFARMSRGFMGKTWDGGDVAFQPETWAAVYRVLKPGAHLLAFGGTRTYHRLVCAIEDAGFEIRDMVAYLYGSGFPKSHDVSKGIDKRLGAEREKVRATGGLASNRLLNDDGWSKVGIESPLMDSNIPATDLAAQWSGWGSAIKPAWEPIICARKPLNTVPIINILYETQIYIASVLCPFLLSVSNAESCFTSNLNVSGEACVSALIIVAALHGIKCDGPSALMGMFNSRGTVATCLSIALSWNAICSALFSRTNTFTTSTATDLTTILKTLKSCILPIIPDCIIEAVSRPLGDLLNVPIVSEDLTDLPSFWMLTPKHIVHVLASLQQELNIANDVEANFTAVARSVDFVLKDVLTALQTKDVLSDLSPALEPICLARKPLSEGTIAPNVLKWGTGALNIDGCRVSANDKTPFPVGANSADGSIKTGLHNKPRTDDTNKNGRWPANVIHDGSDEVVAAFPESNGQQGLVRGTEPSECHNGVYSGQRKREGIEYAPRGDSGSAARFFYTAKADFEDRAGSSHPTIKPLDLIQYLCRLICPPGGTILDCFAGTGTTGEAAWREGFEALLIERDAAYCEDIRRRMALALAGPDERARESIKARGRVQSPGPLFDGLLEAAE